MYRYIHIVHSRGLGLYTEIYYAICRYLASSSAKYLSKEIPKMKKRNYVISLTPKWLKKSEGNWKNIPVKEI